MSANNQLIIKELESGDYALYDVCVECPDVLDQKIGEADTLREAVRLANDYQKSNEVEYGLQIFIS